MMTVVTRDLVVVARAIYSRMDCFLLTTIIFIMVSTASIVERGRLIIGIMEVTSIHTYRATNGYRLELHYLEENLYLSARIFVNADAFTSVSRVKKGKKYVVVGRLSPGSHILEVFDIH